MYRLMLQSCHLAEIAASLPLRPLNRGEAYHQLLKVIGNVGGGDFRGMSEIEVEIWNECMRFIALIIIYYNMSLLSKLLMMNKAEGNHKAIAYLASVSPVASQHLNLSGLYEFSDMRTKVSVDDVVAKMEEILRTTLKDAAAHKKNKKPAI